MLSLALGFVAYLLGGAVKGVTGLGLPLMTVPLLATLYEPRVALALMAVPVLVSNVWQAWRERRVAWTVARFWLLLLPMVVCAFAAADTISELGPRTGSLVFGIIVILFCASQLLPARISIPARAERWLSPAVGAVAGVIGGVSNFFGPPLVMYLVALRLPKDAFVGTVAVLFIAGGTPLYLALAVNGVLTLPVAAASAVGVLPVLAGVELGRRVRDRIPQETFHRVLIGLLLVIGLNLIRRGLL